MSEQAKAGWALAIARRDIPAVESRLAAYCAALGQANRIPGPQRRFHQAQAFRQISGPCPAQGGPQGARSGGACDAGVRSGDGRLTHCDAAYGRCRHPAGRIPAMTVRAGGNPVRT